jgi:hypothetical protein
MVFTYISLYFFSIYVLYIIIFHKLLFPIKQKNLLIFLNNCEIRWWRGFITHQLEIKFFIWIPYWIKNINFLDVNKFTIESFEPFKSNLSKKMSFRDCNYSIFNEENFERLSQFYEKSMYYKPNNIIMFNFSFIESIFQKYLFILHDFNLIKKIYSETSVI